ncbi:MAG: hypothetical protein K0R12_1203, partial [Gammaproteobacteria bacterium]|nr:hypothetical protein [Gammaproteobacteria bacterium]
MGRKSNNGNKFTDPSNGVSQARHAGSDPLLPFYQQGNNEDQQSNEDINEDQSVEENEDINGDQSIKENKEAYCCGLTPKAIVAMFERFSIFVEATCGKIGVCRNISLLNSGITGVAISGATDLLNNTTLKDRSSDTSWIIAYIGGVGSLAFSLLFFFHMYLKRWEMIKDLEKMQSLLVEPPQGGTQVDSWVKNKLSFIPLAIFVFGQFTFTAFSTFTECQSDANWNWKQNFGLLGVLCFVLATFYELSLQRELGGKLKEKRDCVIESYGKIHNQLKECTEERGKLTKEVEGKETIIQQNKEEIEKS